MPARRPSLPPARLAPPLTLPGSRAARVIDQRLRAHWPKGPVRDRLEAALAADDRQAMVVAIVQNSPFLAQIMAREPGWLLAALEGDPEMRARDLLARMQAAGLEMEDTPELMRALRRFRNEMALLIAWADCSGLWGVEQVTEALTATADLAVSLAVDHLLRAQHAAGRVRLPDPATPGAGSGLVVLALGKHGSRELNYSSDIDICVFYDGERAEALGVAEPQAFYVRLTQALARLLQERTADGYVFRVDLRLRPDPGSTQVAVSLPAAFTYYETLGQNWERAAMIKARPVAGDLALGETFRRTLVPFVWRKYFDFGAIADIHAMKRQIQAVKGHEQIAVAGHDVKLGRGGIREIEFFVQTQQLVFGGRRPVLRGARTLEMLAKLHDEGWITAAARDDLGAAYRFLRTVEHRLQMRLDEQTQRLPREEAELDAFARFCGFASRAAFGAALTAHARQVQAHYALLFEDAPSLAADAGTLSFTGTEADPETVATLERLGFRRARDAVETIRGWHFGRRAAVTSPRAREVLTEITPAMLVAFGRTGDPDAGLAALDQAFARMPAAVELLSMLRSHAPLAELFADILGSAPRLARIVAQHPHVLDAVIDPAFGDGHPEPARLLGRMRAQVGEAPSHEEALDRLRDAARQETFLVGARFLSGILGPDQIGEAYAAVADASVDIALEAARRDMARDHGVVAGASLAVIGLGRLGARDLTATSDLDLVVIYRLADPEARSDGARPLDPVVYHQRLTQRLIAALTAPTRRGLLYDVDLRLRPSGSKGPLAVRLDSFAEYQREEAELWEHMALTKARVVAGDAALGQAAMDVIGETLRRPRALATVRAEVAAMRRRIAEAKGEASPWDLKLVAGGLTDIEFIDQMCVLAFAGQAPWDDAGGSGLAGLHLGAAQGLLAAHEAEELAGAHRLMNAVTHWQRFAVDEASDPATLPRPVQVRLCAVAAAPDLRVLGATLAETRRRVRALFARVMHA